MAEVKSFRVVTYNIHKCRGMDRRVRPERIVEVLREINADIIALQEVLWLDDESERGKPGMDQANFIACALGVNLTVGANRRLHGGAYGNAVLSRFAPIGSHNHDISVAGREQRGCLRVDVDLGDRKALHVYNVHLGTSYTERKHQARKLFEHDVLGSAHLVGPRVMVGDFNEWIRGVSSKMLAAHFKNADIRRHLGRARTYPGLLPFLHLDHVYFDSALRLREATLHRSRTALVASDHLPIVADFELSPST